MDWRQLTSKSGLFDIREKGLTYYGLNTKGGFTNDEKDT